MILGTTLTNQERSLVFHKIILRWGRRCYEEMLTVGHKGKRDEKLRLTGDLGNSPANTESRVYLSSAV